MGCLSAAGSRVPGRACPVRDRALIAADGTIPVNLAGWPVNAGVNLTGAPTIGGASPAPDGQTVGIPRGLCAGLRDNGSQEGGERGWPRGNMPSRIEKVRHVCHPHVAHVTRFACLPSAVFSGLRPTSFGRSEARPRRSAATHSQTLPTSEALAFLTRSSSAVVSRSNVSCAAGVTLICLPAPDRVTISITSSF